MWKVVGQRLLLAVPTLLGVTFVVFVISRLAGDPANLLLPQEATAGQREAFREHHGLDQPLLVQYGLFLLHAARGDLGESLASGRQVTDVVLERFPATLELAFLAMAVAVGIGLVLGVLAAISRGGALDRIVVSFIVLGQSIATFWLGIMLILVFAVELRWLPVSGRGTWQQLVLPTITLALFFAAVLARLTRSSMLETLGQDFIRTARSKGLSTWGVIVGHGLRAGLIPIITVAGLQFGALMTGAVVTETVFAWPGVGTLVVNAIGRRDYPIVQGAVLLLAIMYIVINLLVDVMYTVVDPRVRYD